MVALVLAAALIGAAALDRTTTVSNRLNDHLSPARIAVAELEAALVTESSAVRGFLLSGSEDFLDQYAEGALQERRSVDTLRTLLTDEPSALAELTAVEERMEQWRTTTADPLVAARRRNEPVQPGRLAFDDVRARVTVLDVRLDDLRAQAREDLGDARRTRDTVFLGALAALLALIALIAVLLRVVVLSPLDRLSRAVRRVAAGDFDHRLTPGGPADLARLGDDVEAMRHRLVDGLVASQQAREQLEQQQVELRRSNADLEQFAYVASHDLQEPLRKVASFCQMLQRRYADSLDDRARQYIGFAVDGATRMQQLINDLLAFSRIGRVYDNRADVDLDRVLDQVEEILALTVAESGARIERPPLPTVTGDPTLLTMLWQNLIGNAVKFRRPDEPPVITVTVTAEDDLWRLAVQDNGIGIDPEFGDKIFVIFQRLHPRESYPGTGIGLALCKKIVEYHGGTIRLDDTYRDGARLIFTLPAGAAPADARELPAPRREPEARVGR